MRLRRCLIILALLAAGVPGVQAQDLASTCQASSSYDLTLQPDALVFERAQPAPRQVALHDGSLRTDGAAVPLSAENVDRLSLFERELRALVPRVRTVARDGVDLAVQAMHQEAADLHPSAATLAEVDRQLASHAATWRQRIASSQSTHDWDEATLTRDLNQVAADVVPLLAADLGQQALAAVLNGDLQAATRLRDRAAELSRTLRPRLERRMRALQPEIQALCPAIRRLAALQEGVPAADGRALHLLRIDQ